MIDVNDPAPFAELMVRVQARRVAQCYAGAGRTIPPGAASVLAAGTEESMGRDNDGYGAWCVAHGVECVRVLGVTDFQACVSPQRRPSLCLGPSPSSSTSSSASNAHRKTGPFWDRPRPSLARAASRGIAGAPTLVSTEGYDGSQGAVTRDMPCPRG
jgi:hypothetical protein